MTKFLSNFSFFDFPEPKKLKDVVQKRTKRDLERLKMTQRMRPRRDKEEYLMHCDLMYGTIMLGWKKQFTHHWTISDICPAFPLDHKNWIFLYSNKVIFPSIHFMILWHIFWKSHKMSHLNVWIWAFSTNFCPIFG